MPSPLPATIAIAVADELTRLVTTAHVFADKNDLRVRRLASEIDKLIKVDAKVGHLAKACLFQLYGDAESMRYHVSCAAKLWSDSAVDSVFGRCLTNLGFFSEAQVACSLAAEPRRGSFTTNIATCLYCGAVVAMGRLTDQARIMGFDTAIAEVGIAGEVRAILERVGIEDEEIGRILDVAGELMREQGLFYQDVGPQIFCVDDADLGGGCVYYTFALSATPERVTELQFELACRLVDRFPVLPAAFSVGFRCAQ